MILMLQVGIESEKQFIYSTEGSLDVVTLYYFLSTRLLLINFQNRWC
jgi:hypothetical protein